LNDLHSWSPMVIFGVKEASGTQVCKWMVILINVSTSHIAQTNCSLHDGPISNMWKISYNAHTWPDCKHSSSSCSSKNSRNFTKALSQSPLIPHLLGWESYSLLLTSPIDPCIQYLNQVLSSFTNKIYWRRNMQLYAIHSGHTTISIKLQICNEKLRLQYLTMPIFL